MTKSGTHRATREHKGLVPRVGEAKKSYPMMMGHATEKMGDIKKSPKGARNFKSGKKAC